MQCEPENREIHDYCPRVQLKKLLDDFGVPKLSFEQTAHSDRIKTFSPVDSNETKQNVMGKIDQFIKEYSGEDLRNSVMSFVNHQLEKDVKKACQAGEKDRNAFIDSR